MISRWMAHRRGPLWLWVVAPLVLVFVATWVVVTSPLARSGTGSLSQGKPATASSVEGAHFPASAAVDGDSTTRWSSAAADPQWIQVDLGASYQLTQVVLAWQTAYAKAYQVLVSADGNDWDPVYSTSTSTGGTETLPVTGAGRYVRVLGTVRATRYGYSLWQFDVYGSAATGPASSAGPTTTSAPAPSGSTAPPTSAPPAPVGTVTLPTPVAPIVSTGTPPFAQYQEIHANCDVSHKLSDDPIVFPNLPGASHNHTFVGNTLTDAKSTPLSLLAAGSTTCEDVQDTSAYWVPTLLQDGTPVDPSTVTVYYKSGVKDYRTVQPFPPGFRLVVGSPKTPNLDAFEGNYQCGNQGQTKDFQPSCPSGSSLVVHLKAPSCWDGQTLDSPDHHSYMVFPVNGTCPADHPVALPMLEIKASYKLPKVSTAGLAYASGPAYTFHYDFMNGWIQSRLVYLTRHCINEGRQCNGFGVDEHKP